MINLRPYAINLGLRETHISQSGIVIVKTILILRDHPAKRMDYAIDHYAAFWRKSGHRVIDHVGVDNVPNADIAVVHIDLTVIPQQYVDLIEELPRVINGQILDVSRRRYSQLLLDKNSRYEGAVIVKTNRNHGGFPEQKAIWRKTRFPGKAWGAIQKLIGNKRNFPARKAIGRIAKSHDKSWDSIQTISAHRYPIFEDIESVPDGVWTNDNLIVERFLTNRNDELYEVRYYEFFGDKEIGGRLTSHDPIVKFGNCISDEEIPVPDEARQWRKQLAIDFGRLEYLEADGRRYLIDVNKTEGGGAINDNYQPELEQLASGLNFYLD